ncbi:MAG: methyltransferase domain-containing protein [Deltaproteobacteria bacterium]|nr:methyltransferase domain-containing protein [Deltaproteobacteria bacterium]
MRVVDLDRDMRDVIPTGMTRESVFLFERMAEASFAPLRARAGRRVLDLATGIGQDAARVAGSGAFVVGLEPSGRMTALARLAASERPGPQPHFVRGWGDVLPFASGSFDAVFCKGSLDHFDKPRQALAEMARVTAPAGRVVLAIANFESLACRVSRAWDELREVWLAQPLPRGRRLYDVPHDHFTRYELGLMQEQVAEVVELERVEGVSLGWGFPGWNRLLERMPEAAAHAALQGLDRLARVMPWFADVVVLSGRPRRSAIASA